MHAAVTSYAKHGRIPVTDTGEDLTAMLVEDYCNPRAESGPGQVLVVASSRADARRLNRVLRAALVDAGELGDEVVVTSNDYRCALLNCTHGQVTAV